MLALPASHLFAVVLVHSGLNLATRVFKEARVDPLQVLPLAGPPVSAVVLLLLPSTHHPRYPRFFCGSFFKLLVIPLPPFLLFALLCMMIKSIDQLG